MDRRLVLKAGPLISITALLSCGKMQDADAGTSPATSTQPPGEDDGATPESYKWIDGPQGMGDQFCLSWVKDLAPQVVAERLGAHVLGLFGRPAGGWLDLSDRNGEWVVALTQLPGWTLVIEEDSAYCTRDSVIAELSERTTVIVNMRNPDSGDRFIVAKNGRTVVKFNPSDANVRTGLEPDTFLTEMQRAGFDFTDDNQERESTEYDDYPKNMLATLALVEDITGARLTAAVLHGEKLLAVTVPGPRVGSINEAPPMVNPSRS